MNDKPHFWKSTLEEQSEILNMVKRGNVQSAAKSPGNRDVYLVEYGEKQDFNRTANYNSSCGAGSTRYYADKAGKKPVIFFIGAVHGGELEGTSALLNLIKMIETGVDFRGYTNQFLTECINQCNLLIIPLANPDGRSRGTPALMCGASYEELRHFTQGRWKDGTLCGWPACKAVHPIKDSVSYLGSYYNDDGINMMHDNFFGDPAAETKAIFEIADAQAPDFTVLLHGGANTKNTILDTAYVPLFVKEKILTLSVRIKTEADKLNMPFTEMKMQQDDCFPPRSFNLASALHHICGTCSFVYESNQGINMEPMLSPEEILTHHYILFEQTIKYAKELNTL